MRRPPAPVPREDLARYEPLDEQLAGLFAAAWDARAAVPAHDRLPATLREVRLALAQGAITPRVVREPNHENGCRALRRVRVALSEDTRAAIAAVAHEHGVAPEVLYRRVNTRQVSGMRAEAFWVLRYALVVNGRQLSFPECGMALGGFDHSTVISACRRVEERFAGEPGLRERLLAHGRTAVVQEHQQERRAAA